MPDGKDALSIAQPKPAMCRWSQALAGIVWLVAGEARLSQAIFMPPYNEAAFTEVVSKSLMGLVQFGMAIVHARRTPEKACLLLEMHGHMEAHMVHLIAPLQTSNGAPVLQVGSGFCTFAPPFLQPTRCPGISWTSPSLQVEHPPGLMDLPM